MTLDAENREKRAIYYRAWRAANIEKYRASHKKYMRIRRADPAFRERELSMQSERYFAKKRASKHVE